MNRFVLPAASVVIGLLLGTAAVLGVTIMVAQQDDKPPLSGDKDRQSMVLNRVEYGDRT